MNRDFRFGVLTRASDRAGLHEAAREAEGRGYSTLALTDHLDLSGSHVTRLSWLPALASAAAVTSSLRFTTMVANQDLHHPATLAREIATLDIISDGRFEFGLGAGWNPVEYDWAGLTLDSPGVRITRLSEYVAIIRGLLDANATEPFTLHGEHFTITDMPRIPASVQQPLPLMLGGSQRTMLTLAANQAEIVNINTLKEPGTVDDVLPEKIEWIRATGREPEIGTSVVLIATGAADPTEAVELAMPTSPFARKVAEHQPTSDISHACHVLAGDTARIVEELHRRREAYDLSYYIIPAESMDDFQPIMDALA